MECMRNHFAQGVLLDGRYITVCPLNHGSFGLVFKARDVVTGELVALKCLTKPLPPASPLAASSPISVDDRSEELAIHQHIGDHPNIVNLLHHFETEHHTYLVLEYCPNGDLYEAIRLDRGPGQTENIRDAMLQLIDAVEYMHSRGVYHRDIKPENIFLSQNGAIKIGDFGLATKELASLEAAVGSDRYMAPEQMDPPSSGYSPKQADVWAIGICLLNILFSRNPFATPTVRDPLFTDFASDRQSLFDIFPNMSQDTFDVLVHCLAIEPDNRSLEAARLAVQKAVSFTTDDESLDEFCANSAAVVTATANREPLRTPSISSPLMQGSAFPWAKSLAMTKPVLSAIADDELDDLYSAPPQELYPANASLVSVVDSGLGVSIKSSVEKDINIPRSKPMAIAGSLPAISRLVPSMANRKRRALVSKSWSDMMDEDYDTDDDFFLDLDMGQPAAERGDDTPRARPREPAKPNALAVDRKSEDRQSEHNVFIFEDNDDTVPLKHSGSESSILDKWAALGKLRRALLPPAVDKAKATGETTPTGAVQPLTAPRRKRGRTAESRNLNWGVLRQSAPPRNKSGSPTEKAAPAPPVAKSPAPDDQEWYRSTDWRKPMKHDLGGRDLFARARGPIEWVWRV
jgi:serine/threonine protein kinase